MKKMIRSLAIAAAILTTGPAFAQTPADLDSRWTPWLGCWRLVQQDVRDASPSSSIESLAALATGQSARSRRGADEILVCVLPTDGDVGVKMTTFAGGRSVLEQTVLADGVGHPIIESDCRGTQTSEWSRDGERLFTRAELACKSQPTRTVSGVTLLTQGPSARSAGAALGSPAWLDIQAVDVNGDQQVRIRRYERTVDRPAGVAELPADVSTRALSAGQTLSTSRMTIDDVIEASSKIASQAVEAALIETTSRFNLDSRTLIRLADNGVQTNVIDLMVALSFPDHFRVDRTARSTAPVSYGGGSLGGFDPLFYGGYDPYGAYDPYAYYYNYYSPFAYSYWGNYYYYVPGGVSSVITVPGGTSGETTGAHGRVIQGQGYTQVTPISAADSSGTTGSTSSSGGRGSTGSLSGSDFGSSGSSSGGSGGVSSGGYSSGGSSSDGGRTAQPR
jgi:hypothetical protein